ncbi:hypothetical protein P5673_013003, partial [Acropora cervicornis]
MANCLYLFSTLIVLVRKTVSLSYTAVFFWIELFVSNGDSYLDKEQRTSIEITADEKSHSCLRDKNRHREAETYERKEQ